MFKMRTSVFLLPFLLVTSCLTIQLGKNGYPKFPTSILSCGRRITHWRPTREPRVIGGEETPEGAAPWQAALKHHGKHRCGGTVISRRVILTAAHCYTENLIAVAGTNNIYDQNSHKQHARVESGHLHPDYKKIGPHSNDIALLILEKPGFKLNEFIKPICLTHETPQPGTWCEVTGWGTHDPKTPGRPSNILRSAAVPILSLDTCRKKDVYGGQHQTILDNMICAGHLKGGIDACGGDSGSPLVCELNGKYELAGLVSWGEGCAEKDRPGVYTDVTSFLDWIKNVASENYLTIF
ncbi:hypothetical protein ABEB36_008551 [Hypothenemus hampei]|uniref:Peptidase S1 domain-containing protein n=1 Tax=Hypothenemus hampei TaxID=57062 RepID=A0ABD1EM94_HYPHA